MIFDNDKKNIEKKILLLKKNNLFSIKRKKNVLLIEGITDPFFLLSTVKNFISRIKILKQILYKDIQIKIIFSIRNQSDFFISRYVESPQYFENYNYRWKKFENFKKIFEKKFLTKKEKIFLNKLNYYKIFKELLRIFKKK